ncbi:hypothetical protein [Proteus terrae]|uniref:hypothetical protein n=1 Tax=Proteus terrae TaxID=1574161 RepID=UPI000D68A6F1|nr:hypothetical protein [Proteus terrae]
MSEYKNMSSEGLVNDALELIKEDNGNKINGRWLANQTLLNGSNDELVQPSIKANIVCAINIHNISTHEGLLDNAVKRAIDAQTKGELKEAIAEALEIIKGS